MTFAVRYIMICLPAPPAALTRLAVRRFLVRGEDRPGPPAGCSRRSSTIISQRHDGVLRAYKARAGQAAEVAINSLEPDLLLKTALS